MALSLGWELTFLTDQLPIHAGSRSRGTQASIHLGGQGQRKGGRASPTDLLFSVAGVLSLLLLPSNWPSLVRKPSKPFGTLSSTAKIL